MPEVTGFRGLSNLRDGYQIELFGYTLACSVSFQTVVHWKSSEISCLRFGPWASRRPSAVTNDS